MAVKQQPARQPTQGKPKPGAEVLATSQQWIVPLPPPAALRQFGEIIPNGAERIMAMVEQEQVHRISLESHRLDASIRDTCRGHWLGAAISVLAIAGCIYTVHIGAHPAVSIARVGLPVAMVIQAILRSKSGGKGI